MNRLHALLLIPAFLLLSFLPITLPCSENVVEYRYEIIQQYPHSPNIFTQGLEMFQGQLLESAGKYGQSSLSLRTLASSQALKLHKLDKLFFAEGISQLNGRIYQLTWKSGKVFVYDTKSFELLDTFTIKGEGWGLANNGEQLIMSNGSSTLYFIDPRDFSIAKTLDVTAQGQAVYQLNELEWVAGTIYANIWHSNWIVIIDPVSGHVVGKVNLKSLRQPYTGVLNGIAYDSVNQRIFVTGKYWPRLYHIELTPL